MRMRRKKSGDDMRGSSVASAGWLFADLLLVLAMLFLAANTMGIHPPPPVVHATPTPTPSPTPKILAQLDPSHHPFTIDVNRAAFLRNDHAAIATVKQAIIRHIPAGRSVGLIIAYGTASSNCQSEGAYTVATDVYNLVHQLGQSDPATFGRAVPYGPLCNLSGNINQIEVDMFLFAQAPA